MSWKKLFKKLLMKRFLVIGNPIEHSLSPTLHNYWIKSNGIDAIYEKQKLDDSELIAMVVFYIQMHTRVAWLETNIVVSTCEVHDLSRSTYTGQRTLTAHS